MSAPTLRSFFARLSLSSSACSSPFSTTVNAPLTIRSPTSIVPSTRPLAPSFPPTRCPSRSFHVTSSPRAKPVVPPKGSRAPKKKGKGGKGGKSATGPDPRIVSLKESMPRAVPAPLRFARNRALRHWTIHRAWQLFQRKERDRQETELQRMYRSMHNACEELRNTSGPGTRDEGYLYRVAMEKHGMYGHNAIPIEYARPQTETPPRRAWNHEWKR
ncbi:hypothetical protein GGR50DRAFT_662576 [Xylaria sp. CBS 124048]|nr:hypothetical protein GGR50DRAFT_662576 [Xylaria sp. CBS 124048]